jgi:hypothetical protein
MEFLAEVIVPLAPWIGMAVLAAVVLNRGIETPWFSIGVKKIDPALQEELRSLEEDLKSLRERVTHLENEAAERELLQTNLESNYKDFKGYITDLVRPFAEDVQNLFITSFDTFLSDIGLDPSICEIAEKESEYYEQLITNVCYRFVIPDLKRSIYKNHYPARGISYQGEEVFLGIDGEESQAQFEERFVKYLVEPLISAVMRRSVKWVADKWKEYGIRGDRVVFVRDYHPKAVSKLVQLTKVVCLKAQANRMTVINSLINDHDYLTKDNINMRWRKTYE